MAPATHDRERLKRILDLSDRLERLRRRVRERGATAGTGDFAKEIREIAGRVVSIGLPGALGTISKEHHLGPQEQMVILLLLNRRIETGDAALAGRELLATIFPSAYGILSGAALLERGAPLRASGAIETVGQEAENPLDTVFAVSDALFHAVEREARPSRGAGETAAPYDNHWEHLADLGRLTALLLRRANAIFEIDPFGNRAYVETESTTRLLRRVDRLEAGIRARAALTTGCDRFPLVRLARDLKLDDDEQLVVVGLLVQECYYGSPGLEAVDCVKMVSRSPEELLRKRSLLAPGGRLRKGGLIDIEEPVDDRELTGDVLLQRWVAPVILGELSREGGTPIGPDTRLEFHEYLKGLGDSEQFFRDLGA